MTALLTVRDLQTIYPRKTSQGGPLRVVDGVSFEVASGETFGIVGESGCGKSTLARTLLRLIPASSGAVRLGDTDVLALRNADLRDFRRHVQMIFQDPVGSLNPRMRVGEIVGEALDVHRLVNSRREREDRVAAMLQRVGMSPDDARRYPHEFSGGQRQRIGIARALVLRPKLIVCDEPVSALDVSIQSQVLNLLHELQAEFGLAYVFIAHNLGVVRHFCDRIAVMQKGRFVECESADAIFSTPQHAYTKCLLAAAPRLAIGRERHSGESQHAGFAASL